MAKKAKGTVKVRIMKPLWGKFKMPYEVGHEPKLEEKVAAELIAEGYAISAADATKADKASEPADNEPADKANEPADKEPADKQPTE